MKTQKNEAAQKAYEGIGKIVKVIQEKRGEGLDPAVNEYLTQLSENSKEYARFFEVYKDEKMEGQTKENLDWIKANSKIVTSAETKEKLNSFFEGMDDAVAKTEEWKNLYQFYLENTVSEKSVQVREWAAENRGFRNRINSLKRQYPSMNLKEINSIIKEKEDDLEKIQKEIDSLPSEQKYRAEENKFLESKISYMLRVDGLFSRKIEDHEEKIAKYKKSLETIDEVIAEFENNKEWFNDLHKKAEEAKEKAKLYDRNVSYVNHYTSQLDDEFNKALKTAEVREDLKNYVAAERNHKRTQNLLDKVKEKVEKGLPLTGLENDISSALNVKKEEIAAIAGKDIIGNLEKKVKEAYNSVESEKNKVKELQRYNELFGSKKIKKAESEIKKAKEYLEAHPEDYKYKDEYEKLTKEKNDFLEKYREKYNIILNSKISISSLETVIDDKRENRDMDTVIRYFNSHRERIAKDLGLHEEKLKLLPALLEAEKERSEDPEYIKKDKEYDKIFAEKRGLEDTKKELISINQSVKELKGKVDPKAVEANITEKAEVLFDQKDMRKGSHKNSSEYEKMISALEVVKNWNNPEVKAEEKDGPATLNEALNNLKEAADGYLKAKNAQIRLSPSSMRQTRLALAKSISEFAKTGAEHMTMLPAEKDQLQKQGEEIGNNASPEKEDEFLEI